MTHDKIPILSAPILLAAVLAPLSAQDPQGDAERAAKQEQMQKQQMMPQFMSLEHMLGAKVMLASKSGEKSGEKSGDEKSGEKSDDQSGRPHGDVKDLVVDASTGEVRWVVLGVGDLVGSGDKTVAVPIAAVDCRPKGEHEAHVTLHANRNSLQKLPAFDLAAARDTGLAAAMRVVEASWTAVGDPDMDQGSDDSKSGDPKQKESDQDPDVIVHGAAVAAVPVAFACATQLDNWAVHGSDQAKIGSVSNVFLMANRMPAIAYLVVSDDEGRSLVPFAAVHPMKHGENWTWMVSKTADEMAKAPAYEEPEKGHVSMKACKRAHEFFGVDSPMHDKMREKMGDKSKMHDESKMHDKSKAEEEKQKSGGRGYGK